MNKIGEEVDIIVNTRYGSCGTYTCYNWGVSISLEALGNYFIESTMMITEDCVQPMSLYQ